jgi:hypothetical protein
MFVVYAPDVYKQDFSMNEGREEVLPYYRHDEPDHCRCHYRPQIYKANHIPKGLTPLGKFECRNRS